MTYREAKANFEREYLAKMIARAGTHVAAAAAAGLSRQHFQKLLNRYQMTRVSPNCARRGNWGPELEMAS